MIETERLILRGWHSDDADALFKYASDPEVGPIAGWIPHASIEYSREKIRNVFSAQEIYAVVLKSTNEPVGCCGIVFADGMCPGDAQPCEGEIGYWIGRPFWGQGLIPEAVKALISHAFEDLRLKSLWCSHYDGNDRSRRVCEKSGFIYHHTNHDVETPLGDMRTEHFYKLTNRLGS